MFRALWFFTVAFLLVGRAAIAFGQTDGSPPRAGPSLPGLKVSFRKLDGPTLTHADAVVRANLALYVPEGASPTPFLGAGGFVAEWTGFVLLDLRSEYRFHASFNGDLQVELNGNPVLQTNSHAAAPVMGLPVRLNKGPNALKVIYRSPEKGDAFVRVEWAPKGGLPSPISAAALVHPDDAELRRMDLLRLGQDLFAEHRCIGCHATPKSNGAMLELSMDAPALDGIGSRCNSAWMASWIFDPKGQRASARMPRLFRGPQAQADAEAAALFLASLQEGTKPQARSHPERAEAGRQLFERLHCLACHIPPEDASADPDRLGLTHVRAKFPAGALTDFLKAPAAHYAWIRMPDFRLSDDESAQLATYLEAQAVAPATDLPPAEKAVLERGQELVQTRGCLNCHALRLENRFSARPLAELGAPGLNSGCLTDISSDGGKAPQFAFAESERLALRAFLGSDRKSLARFDAVEFAERQTRHLNCLRCHGKFEGFPGWEVLVGKLRPEWTRAFLSGAIAYKPRPWLEARMPAFRTHAAALADGLALTHGYPTRTESEPPIDAESAKVGRQLVSAVGGFSCVGCHVVGEVGATQVFESAGINLRYAGERLLKPYFQRWLRNPLAVDSSTKMPVYFDEEGRSPLADVLDGDGPGQIRAIWEYLRLGSEMSSPPTP